MRCEFYTEMRNHTWCDFSVTSMKSRDPRPVEMNKKTGRRRRVSRRPGTTGVVFRQIVKLLCAHAYKRLHRVPKPGPWTYGTKGTHWESVVQDICASVTRRASLSHTPFSPLSREPRRGQGQQPGSALRLGGYMAESVIHR